ncbi:MAG: hypothetical protein ACE5HE_12090 [Phycisphaerae bacterium]
MPDEHSYNPSGRDPSGPGRDAAEEDELDALLEEAAALADDVTDEVGSLEAGRTPASDDLAATHVGGPPPQIDAQLAELDRLLGEMNKELGEADSPGRDGTVNGPRANPGDPGSDDPGPDDAPAPGGTIDDTGRALAELGEADQPSLPSSGTRDSTPLPGTELDDDLDAQLAALDGLLTDAGDEQHAEPTPRVVSVNDDAVDDSAPDEPADKPRGVESSLQQQDAPSDPPTTDAPTAAPDSRAGKAVTPDFMAEFMAGNEEEEEEEEEGANDASPASPPARETHPAEPRQADRSDYRTSAGDLVGSDTQCAAPPDAQETHDPHTALAHGAAWRSLRKVLRGVEPVALKLLDAAVGVLESADRPVRRLGYWPRAIAGWLAIATLALSLIVYVASLL